MSEALARVIGRATDWLERARAAGWLDETDAVRFGAVERGTPADLFVAGPARPLVVAFFGGTGVGKSSLLNRLAGAEVARTGVERPTSREVTVYVHQSVELADLPAELPIDRVHVQRHSAAAHRDVLWMDAPDIDSTEEANRLAAFAWLPHIDLVCYVVSPERYRDDVGWRMLRERGQRHGWAFILNRWDEGDPRQADDFTRMLREAGFDDPVLLRTCCQPGRALPSPDEFDQLQAALTALLAAHGVRELERLGHRARLQDLRSAVQAAEKKFGDENRWREWRATAQQRWEVTAGTIRDGLEWSVRAAAARFAARDPSVLDQVRRLMSVRPDRAADAEGSALAAGRGDRLGELAREIWDAWADGKLNGWLDEVELAGRRGGLAVGPVREKLDAVAASAGPQLAQAVEDELRAAMSRPGTALGRVARRGTGFFMAFLPAAALVWVAWKVVEGYYFAGRSSAPFLGSDFAIHSGLLVLLAWVIPFTADRFLRPSLERTALRGLRAGLERGLDDVHQALLQALSDAEAGAAGHREEAHQLQRAVTGLLVRPVDVRVPVLSRLMAAYVPDSPQAG